MVNTFLNALDWRTAQKHFDPAKKVSEEDLAKILRAAKMAPTSFGLQPFRVYVVSDQSVKMKLKAVGFNQQQFEDSSHVLVFCSRNDLADRVKKYFDIASDGDAEKRKEMEGYENMMKGFAEGKEPEAVTTWAGRQTYLALGFALAACAEMRIDACPMEGFDPTEFGKILSLEPKFHAFAVVAIGYRKNEDTPKKVRFPDEDLFVKV